MLKRIHFPWGSGIGTLGFRFTDKYADFSLVDGHLQLFIARYENGKHGNFNFTARSWYRISLKGLTLKKKEDIWGQWKNGKRVPPLYELPEDEIPNRAWELRKYFKPYQTIDWYGEKLEVISFPCPEKESVTVMMREPDDPTTLREVVLENYIPECGPVIMKQLQNLRRDVAIQPFKRPEKEEIKNE